MFVGYCNLALVLAEMGRYDEAVDRYQQALRLDPDSHPIRERIGPVLFKASHAAIVAASSEGQDGEVRSETERTTLRLRALDCLRYGLNLATQCQRERKTLSWSPS